MDVKMQNKLGGWHGEYLFDSKFMHSYLIHKAYPKLLTVVKLMSIFLYFSLLFTVINFKII